MSSSQPEPQSQTESQRSSPTLLEVGKIAKAHGLGGEVVVDLVTNRIERLDRGSTLLTPSGRILTVASSSPFNKRWIVAFEGVSDRNEADRLRGTPLLAEPADESEGLWVHELVGAIVEDQDGNRLGIVASVVANPASDLLELEGGSLVPLVFVVDQSPGRVVVDVPDGLLE